MSQDGHFWIRFWVIAGVTLVGLGACAKGCNDSDNKLYANAVANGCSIVNYEHKGHQIVCPGYKQRGEE